MKLVLTIFGVLLILVGLLAFAGVGLTTNKAKVELGPLQATVKEERSLPPVVAGATIVVGIVLLAAGARKSR